MTSLFMRFINAAIALVIVVLIGAVLFAFVGWAMTATAGFLGVYTWIWLLVKFIIGFGIFLAILGILIDLFTGTTRFTFIKDKSV